MTALVLLDVDGVVNAVPRGRPSPAWPDWRTGEAVADGSAYPITWSPTVVSAVRSWQAAADVRWLTTWGHDANRSLRHLLDLPELPVAGTYDEDLSVPTPSVPGDAHAAVAPAAPDPLTGRWWKFDVVRRIVRADPGRRLVWLDDDLAGERAVAAWMRRETDCLLIAPDVGSGLLRRHLEAVEDFLRG